MAEQIDHNVVNQIESTSGSASLVDVAANQITPALSESGSLANPKPTKIDTSDKKESGDAEQNVLPSAGNTSVQLTGDADLLKQANGISRPQSAEIDTSADPSVTSDTDIRGDNGDQAREESNHNRTNSIKKPPTFSRVSVTKNFLAKATTPVVPKAGDKAAPAPVAAAPQLAALRPRLVAKTAASLSNLSRTRLGTENSSGPDASKVWNKNRPAPAMPPKQLTDEELKQQYGIHLATRLQSDDAGKGSKWADIDDEEDDWVPEAVEWMDGTKSTLNPTEAAIAAEQKEAPAPAPAEVVKPSLVLGQRPSQTLTAKTILKPGAALQIKQQAPPSASSDKQVLIAKTPAATPTKSPWAALPPVEKVSPINPPVQIPARQTPFPSQDARAGDFSSYPAREIAADTFDRSWPAEPEHRELFNSANGRYEPAPEGRRNSIRFDRKHAVLRRPSHGVAEQPGPWAHRRGSSVSQGSSSIQRPISVAQSVDSHGANSTAPDSAGHPLASASSAWAQQLPPPPPAGEEVEDPIKAQERVMREKREAARLRRQEEEAQEEIAKQARLKAKLEALAGAGLSRKERQQATITAETAPQPTTIATPAAAAAAAAAETATESADTADAKPSPAEDAKSQVQSQAMQSISPSLSHAAVDVPSPRLTQREQIGSSAASRSTYQTQVSGSYQTGPSSAFSSPGDRERKPQPFGRSTDTFAPWPTASLGGDNVWGVKGIGNGTFGSSAFSPLTSHHQTTSLAPPPGMIRPSTTSTRISPPTHVSSSPNLQDASLAHQHRIMPELDSLPDHYNQRLEGLAPSPAMARPQHNPGPIGPPSRMQAPRQEQISGWQAAAQQLPGQYNIEANASTLRHQDMNAQIRRNPNRFNETFRSTAPLRAEDQDASITSDSTKVAAVKLPGAPTVLPPHLRRQAFTTAPLAPAPAATDDAPPPPETTSHPVYGDHRLNVRLPPPSAVVKLPPSHTLPTRSFGARPIVQSDQWQARFNGLFNRTPIQTETPPSPPKTPPKAILAPALAISSSSRNTMTETSSKVTVSVPQPLAATSRGKKTLEGFTLDTSSDITSKHSPQSFTDELGFGSRPRVSIPKISYAATSLDHINLLAVRPNPRDSNNIAAQTVTEPFVPSKRVDGFFVKLPGSNRNKLVKSGSKPRTPVNNKARAASAKVTASALGEAGKGGVPAVPTSRKTSTPKASKTVVDAPSSSGKDAAAPAKPIRKRSSHHKSANKPTAAAEQSTTALPAAIKT